MTDTLTRVQSALGAQEIMPTWQMTSAADEAIAENFSGLRTGSSRGRSARGAPRAPTPRCGQVLRDCRLRSDGSAQAEAGIARFHNLAFAA